MRERREKEGVKWRGKNDAAWGDGKDEADMCSSNEQREIERQKERQRKRERK